MKKILASVAFCAFSMLMVGCGDESLEGLNKELKDLKEEARKIKGDDLESYTEITAKSKELERRIKELREKLIVEKVSEAEDVVREYVEVIKNNNINKALEFRYYPYDSKEKAKKWIKEGIDNINFMIETLDLAQPYDFIEAKEVKDEDGGRVLKYEFMDKNGKKREIYFDLYFNNEGKWKVVRVCYDGRGWGRCF